MKREQILLIGVAAILALLIWSKLNPDPIRKSRVTQLPLELADLGPVDPVHDLAADGGGRDPFRQPRDVVPLPALELPFPDLSVLPALLPPPLPDSGPDYWSRNLLAHPKAPPGDLEDLVEMDALDQGAVEENGGEALEDGDAQDGDEDYANLYDSIQRTTFLVLWGRILDEDRWDKRPGEPLTFQQVDPRTGTDRGQPVVFEGDQYTGFSFAKTLRNDIELRVRALDPSAGAVLDRRQLIRWLLDQGVREPVAFQHAEQLALEGIRLAGEDLKSWLSLGSVWERTFRYDQAFALYAGLAGVDLPSGEIRPQLPVEVPAGKFATRGAPRVGMARVLRIFQLEEPAENILREAADLPDSDPAAPLELGLLLLQQGLAEEALPWLRKASGFQSSRNHPEAIRNFVALGQAHLQQGQWPEAKRAFQDALNAAQSGALSEVEARAGLIATDYLAGRFAEAYASSVEAVEALGAQPNLLYLRGICAAANGEPAAEVVRDLRAASRADKLDAAPALSALAFWFEVMGQEDQASESLNAALELDPEWPYARYLRARRARQDGNTATARTDLRYLIGGWPRCAAALAELGWLLHGEGRLDRAEVALRRAIVEAPQIPELALRRGINLLSLQRVEDARASLRDALALQPDLHEARNALAWAAYREGDLDTCIAEFGELMDMLRAEPTHTQYAYAQLWSDRVAGHDKLRLWTDEFEGTLFRPEWDPQSQARLGVEPAIRNGRLQILGRHREEGETRVFRRQRALTFQAFHGEISAGSDHRGDAGLYLSLENRAGRATWFFHVYRDRDGAVWWQSRQSAREIGHERSSLRVAAGTPLSVQFDLDREQEPPVLTVTANGRQLFQDKVTVLKTASGELTMGAFARTRQAVAVDVAVERVELVFAQP
ncbi:MAG: tetratricopeptide repeat protein [Planctomycetota bacterium]|nr:MAG: tetratricopeptide repeat protein [Planctomycetota bacterium]